MNAEIMNAVFENGYAVVAGNISAYNYDAVTGEYLGKSVEYIHVGVSMPGNSTDIEPPKAKKYFAIIFNDGKWKYTEDHRGKTIYSTNDGKPAIVDYLGGIKEGYVTIKPSTQYDKWDGKSWVTDESDQKSAQISAADQHRQMLIAYANEITSDWRTELALGIIDDDDKERLTEWMKYIKAVKAVDSSTAPDVSWPEKPAV